MILFRAFLEGTNFQVEALPFQAFEKELKVSASEIKITVPLTEIVKLPLGTIFCASKYLYIEDDENLIISKEDILAMMFDDKVLYSAINQNNQERVDYFIKYLLESGDFTHDYTEKVVNEFKEYGFTLDWEELTRVPEIGEPGSNMKRSIAAMYPVPNREDIGFHIEPEMWYLLVRNVLRGENVMLIGDTGTGKTEIVKHLAKAMNKELYIQDMGTVQDAQSALLGTHTLNKEGVSEFKHAPFVSHIQSGGIVLLDELSRAPLAANNILFPCLDNRRYLPVDVAHNEEDQKIMVNDDTVFIATANIGGEYTGTNALDRALLDRFFPIETQYPQERDEVKVLMTRTGIDETPATAIVRVANEVRKQYKDQELSSSISVRHTLQTAGLVVDGFDLTNALQAVVIPLFDDGIGTSERAKVKSIIAAF